MKSSLVREAMWHNLCPENCRTFHKNPIWSSLFISYQRFLQPVAHFEIQIDFISSSETRCCSFFDPQKDMDNRNGLTTNHLGISHIETGTLSKTGSKSTEAPLSRYQHLKRMSSVTPNREIPTWNFQAPSPRPGSNARPVRTSPRFEQPTGNCARNWFRNLPGIDDSANSKVVIRSENCELPNYSKCTSEVDFWFKTTVWPF